MRLSKRLTALVQAIAPCDTLLDIGCDHGLLECAVVEQSRARRVIASDISAASVNKTRRLVQARQLDAFVDCRQGDGFSVLRAQEHVDAAVIAGIGGLVISRILREGETVARGIERIYLLPSCDSRALRAYLRCSGWNVLTEALIRDAGRIYAMFCICTGQGRYPGGVFDIVGYAPVLQRQAAARALAHQHLHAMCEALENIRAKKNAHPARVRTLRRQIGQTKLLLQYFFYSGKKEDSHAQILGGRRRIPATRLGARTVG